MSTLLAELLRQTVNLMALESNRPPEPALSSLLAQINLLPAVAITDITDDNRQVQPGALFLAYQGSCGDSKNYLTAALAAGAVALLIDQPPPVVSPLSIPYLVVPELARWIAPLAEVFFGYPQRQLRLYAVTGTNGKSSVSYYLAQLLPQLDPTRRSAMIGTVGWGLLADLQPTVNTTPGVIELRRMLAQLVQAGVTDLVMEVSSHSLDQGRVAGIHFHQAIFTNLTQDHLDYHHTMAAYAAAKFSLFEGQRYPLPAQAIINLADSYGQQLQQRLQDLGVGASLTPLLTFNAAPVLTSLACSPADLQLRGAQVTLERVRGVWVYADQQVAFHAPLLGGFNLENLTAVAAALVSEGYSLTQIAALTPTLSPVRGRMERVVNTATAAAQVIVDYAHTPDALAKALRSMRAYSANRAGTGLRTGRLWVVFGCGGERDQAKRPQMGRIAAQLADQVIITSDNPRHESPLAIIDQIVSGIPPAQQHDPDKIQIEPNRALAIALALAAAQPGDLILIAGKGHENYQLIGDQRLPFSDQQQVQIFRKSAV